MRYNTRQKILFCHLPWWWWWHCWLEVVTVIKWHKVYGGQKTRLRRNRWTFISFTSACPCTSPCLIPWQPPSHAKISGLSHQDERFVVVTSALIILKCSAFSGPATLSADADSPVFFTLYRRICFLRFSNHPLLVWKMPFFSPSQGTVVVYLHGLLPYHSTTDRPFCASYSSHTHRVLLTFLRKESWLAPAVSSFDGTLPLMLLLIMSFF